MNRKRYKFYKLTKENRHLADSLQDTYVDEEKGLLWSKQDLSGLITRSNRLEELEEHEDNRTSRITSLEFGTAVRLIFAYVVLKLMGVREPGSAFLRRW